MRITKQYCGTYSEGVGEEVRDWPFTGKERDWLTPPPSRAFCGLLKFPSLAYNKYFCAVWSDWLGNASRGSHESNPPITWQKNPQNTVKIIMHLSILANVSVLGSPDLSQGFQTCVNAFSLFVCCCVGKGVSNFGPKLQFTLKGWHVLEVGDN